MSLFPEISYPPGFLYVDDLLTVSEEESLLEFIAAQDLKNVVVSGYEGRRMVRYYGYTYGDSRFVPQDPLPTESVAVRDRLASHFGLDPSPFVQGLINQYPIGSTIGWHKDRPMFGSKVLGVSLGGACTMRLRRRRPDGFDRAEVLLHPRSAYLISSEARWKWQHSIPAVPSERWSLTFRTLRADWNE